MDGALHAIGFAPEVCLGGTFLDAQWSDVSVAVNISAYSYKALADAVTPLMTDGGALVGLDFDASVSWPSYDWMGVAKAAFESTSRYLARYLGPQGIRVNLVAAGPLKTLAAKSIPGFSQFEDVWDPRSPLGWDASDSSAVAKACVALLSDWFPVHHRRDRPRRRRLPRHRRLTDLALRSASLPAEQPSASACDRPCGARSDRCPGATAVRPGGSQRPGQR